MVTITRRTVTKHRHEYLIDAPATCRDMDELMLVVRQDMKTAGRDIRFDDAFHVEPHEEQILAYWDEDEEVSEGRLG